MVRFLRWQLILAQIRRPFHVKRAEKAMSAGMGLPNAMMRGAPPTFY